MAVEAIGARQGGPGYDDRVTGEGIEHEDSHDADSHDQGIPDHGVRRGTEDSSNTSASGNVPLDLDRIEADLAGVEAALARLDTGTYFNDELTGEPLSAELLAAQPTARRSAG